MNTNIQALSRNIIIATLLFLQLTGFLTTNTFAQNILLFEDFESGDFAGKGWYDAFPDHRTSDEFKNGTYAYESHFAQGATSPGAGRHLFPETDKFYISYWVKYSSNWVGSGVPYHPHEWNILTNEDGIYQGPADTYLTAYVEQNGGKPLLALQDSKNVDPNCILLNNNSFVGCNGDFNSYNFTEDRSACSCNGISGYLDRRDCFSSPGSTHGYYSSRSWHADSVYFRNTPGPYYKNDWHKVEAYFELNNIAGGIGVADGKIRYWYDGRLLITSDSILLRTGSHPDMKFNQLLFAPYIGVGSPIDQTFWIDDLTIADGIPLTSVKDQIADDIELNIYPNPSEGNFSINIPNTDLINNSEIEFFDVTGKLIFHQKIISPHQFFNQLLQPGLYIARLNNSKFISAPTKLIIE